MNPIIMGEENTSRPMTRCPTAGSLTFSRGSTNNRADLLRFDGCGPADDKYQWRCL